MSTALKNINQTAQKIGNYSGTPVHQYLYSLIRLLEHRQNVAERLTQRPASEEEKRNYIKIIEHCNSNILNVLNIPE